MGKALCDLGPSINLMPLFVFKSLRNVATSPTIVTLQLANRSIKYHVAKIKDILVKVV